MSEQRRSTRYRVCQMIRLDYGHERIVNASTLNYSKNGLLCQTDVDLPLGTSVAVILDMGEEGVVVPVPVEAKVVRRVKKDDGSFEIGFDLVELATDGHQKMMDFFEAAAKGCAEI